jgi:hypothetical protein
LLLAWSLGGEGSPLALDDAVRIPMNSLLIRQWRRYTGVREMIEMSKTPGEYKYPLTRWVRGNQAGSNRGEPKSNG